jgi:ABC-type sugar transport system ATPase subunit
MTTIVEEKAPVLQIRHISKRFDTTQALDDVSLDLYPGEIHAVMGENDAGKSTLIKIMTGVYHAHEGEILRDGNRSRWLTRWMRRPMALRRFIRSRWSIQI